MKIKVLLSLVFVWSAVTSAIAKPIELFSPDKKLKVEVDVADNIMWRLIADGNLMLDNGVIGLQVGDTKLGVNAKLQSKSIKSVNSEIKPVVPLKFSVVPDVYNQLTMKFKGGYSIEFRAYDDGVAYRLLTDMKGDIDIAYEDVAIEFPGDYKVISQQPGSFGTSNEELYSISETAGNDWKDKNTLNSLPLLIEAENGYKILMSESGLIDYPGLHMRSHGRNGFSSDFAKVPVKFGDAGDRHVSILEEAGYIARTAGKRALPWRYFMVARDDKDILTNTFTCRLAPESVVADTSWIKPGKTTWEWWNGAIPYGPDVDFEAGCNTDTYKYFIDFASKYGLEYVLLDEGWAINTYDPFNGNPDVDLQELIRYGKEKNVGVLLWLTWLEVDRNMDLFEKFADWGVAGVKVDFMDRSDQWMVDFYERVAKAAADNGLLVDFHGAFKPAGLEYKYPNVISYEGIRGMEYMGGCVPDNTLFIPFIRNAVGGADYTPGAMISMQPEAYRAERPNSASIGTRAYQMALYVVLESGLQMLADNPTLYYRNPDCTEFIASVPTTFDEIVPLDAKVGEYVVVAKRKGDKWYVGAITNNKENEREFSIPLDFLQAGKDYTVTAFSDGPNAGRQAMDYRKATVKVKKGDVLPIKLARNGGFAAVIE